MPKHESLGKFESLCKALSRVFAPGYINTGPLFSIYYIDVSVLLEITSGVFSISSLVKISMTSFTAFCIESI